MGHREWKQLLYETLAKQEGVVVDLGCGFKPEVGQRSIPGAVGLDLNFAHGEAMVDNPISASVEYIPIREACVDFVNASAILEHLPQAGRCMWDMRRIMKQDATGFILIPKKAKQIPQTLKRFIREFPFATYRVIRTLINANTFWKLPGVPHITQIDLEDVTRFFKITRVMQRRYRHAWFHYGPFRLLRKWGLLGRDVLIDTYSEWLIWIRK